MTYFTAQAQMRGLKERLDLTVAGELYKESLDANGFPILEMSKNGEKSFLKIAMIEPSGHVDGFGLVQRQYSPHMATLVKEETASLVEIEASFKFLAQAAKLGMKVEIWEGAGAGAAADFDAALALSTKVAVLPANEIYGMTLSQ
jgi:hypothetical protein